MSKNIQRVAKLETGLTPKQAILLWFQEAHGFNTIFERELYIKLHDLRMGLFRASV